MKWFRRRRRTHPGQIEARLVTGDKVRALEVVYEGRHGDLDSYIAVFPKGTLEWTEAMDIEHMQDGSSLAFTEELDDIAVGEMPYWPTDDA